MTCTARCRPAPHVGRLRFNWRSLRKGIYQAANRNGPLDHGHPRRAGRDLGQFPFSANGNCPRSTENATSNDADRSPDGQTVGPSTDTRTAGRRDGRAVGHPGRTTAGQPRTHARRASPGQTRDGPAPDHRTGVDAPRGPGPPAHSTGMSPTPKVCRPHARRPRHDRRAGPGQALRAGSRPICGAALQRRTGRGGPEPGEPVPASHCQHPAVCDARGRNGSDSRPRHR